jgi:hypothetical protein
MKYPASITVPHREKTDHRVLSRLGRIALMTLVAVAAGIIVFVPGTTRSSKFISDTTTGSNFTAPGAAHVVVHGLHVAVPNSLAQRSIEQLIPLP